ncbi:MAG: polymerase, partial [Pseudomonadota bacterium]
GLQQIRGLSATAGGRLVQARKAGAFRDVQDLCLRAGLDAKARGLLAEAGALRGLAGHRHRAHWAAAGVEASRPLLAAAPEQDVRLPVPSEAANLLADYASLGFTLGRHPLEILRARLKARRCLSSQALRALTHGTPVRHAGLVTSRQRPSTANGTTFLTLEDEHGMVNVIVWRSLYEQQRRVLLESRLLCVEGRVESADGVQHLVASRLHDLSALLGELDVRARDFH